MLTKIDRQQPSLVNLVLLSRHNSAQTQSCLAAPREARNLISQLTGQAVCSHTRFTLQTKGLGKFVLDIARRRMKDLRLHDLKTGTAHSLRLPSYASHRNQSDEKYVVEWVERGTAQTPIEPFAVREEKQLELDQMLHRTLWQRAHRSSATRRQGCER